MNDHRKESFRERAHSLLKRLEAKADEEYRIQIIRNDLIQMENTAYKKLIHILKSPKFEYMAEIKKNELIQIIREMKITGE